MDWGCMSFDSSERRWACNIRICARRGSAESDMYQLYHGITDTKQPFPPFLNEFFFGGFLKHRTTMSYGTFATSASELPTAQKPPSDAGKTTPTTNGNRPALTTGN